MIKATVNGKKEFTIEGAPANWDMVALDKNRFHIIKDNRSYNATLIQWNAEEKTMVINVNGTDYELHIKDRYDLLLEQLGIKAGSTVAVQQVKAPMPGLIIQVAVAEGTVVKKGDPLLILEAMKMENVLKSPRDGEVKKVCVQLKQAVEKNQVLIEFA